VRTIQVLQGTIDTVVAAGADALPVDAIAVARTIEHCAVGIGPFRATVIWKMFHFL
jgi:hypothetical protein